MKKTSGSSKLNKSVAVIGAGVSGLAASKCLLDEGLDVTTFEQRDKIGGIWAYKEQPGGAYKGLRIDTSKEIYTFSDFPIPDDYPEFPLHWDIAKYFNQYVDHFKFRDRINFNTEVIKVAQNGEKWDVTIKREDKVTTKLFDAVVVCNGHHWDPYVPEFPGAENFSGKILHSSFYKDTKTPIECEGKNVVVVGIGNSAIDIATEASFVSNQVYLVSRSGAYILPKFINGKVSDHMIARWISYLPSFIPVIGNHITDLIEDYYYKDTVKRAFGDMKQYGLAPKYKSSAAAHPSVSEYLISRISHNKIIVKKQIIEISKNEILFDDETKTPVDIIYLATGYNISLPFFDIPFVDKKNNGVSFYKRIFPVNYSNLAFVGLIQPYGAIVPMVELQSRLVAKILTGEMQLPSKEEMNKEIEEFHNEIKNTMNPSRRHTIECDHLKYTNDLADILEVQPKLWKHPKLITPLLFDVLHPTQYRLDGPGKWNGAEAYLLKLHKQLQTKYK